MILPMMGLLFVAFAAAPLGAAMLYFVHPRRRLLPLALIPALAAVGSLLFCWGLAVGLERFFASQQAGGIGFFGGYVLGGFRPITDIRIAEGPLPTGSGRSKSPF
ncbi:MAG TPA: hypothetical protein VME63_06555 [Dyella sp.]|uniref:hypothetical protein n=1 Tax=Dyella sp. TaxID=1869338 RepID=UPI002B7E97A4|nr:hypothetical protein [Dyella sp.]HTV85045.1 hypothetical protein [Dyella sp.]